MSLQVELWLFIWFVLFCILCGLGSVFSVCWCALLKGRRWMVVCCTMDILKEFVAFCLQECKMECLVMLLCVVGVCCICYLCFVLRYVLILGGVTVASEFGAHCRCKGAFCRHSNFVWAVAFVVLLILVCFWCWLYY